LKKKGYAEKIRPLRFRRDQIREIRIIRVCNMQRPNERGENGE
jgi:hypothetical protein